MRAAIISLFLVLTVGTTPLAEGKITADPNAPGARQPEETATETDVRLDQEVTLEARQKSVLSILTDLSQKTGITFKAGQNSKDWESRDIKMNVFATDLPLRELMGAMARVMKFRWTREGKEDAYTYRFYMDRRTRLEAEERRAREEEERQRRLAEKRSKALSSYYSAANMSPQELAKLKTENPFLYAVGSTGILGSIGRFFSESPSAIEAIMNGRAANISAATLSAGAQQGLLNAMQGLWQFENSMGDRDRPFPDELASNIGQVSISINRHMEQMRGGPPVEDFLLGEMQMRYAEHHVDFPIFDPESSIAQLFGKAIIKSQDEGMPLRDALQDAESQLMKLFQEHMRKPEQGDPEPEHPDEPALHVKIKFETGANRLPLVQEDLAKQSKLAMVSDSFGPGQGMARFKGEELELKEILDKIARGFQYNWEKHGSVIEFRDRKWYEKRAALIPEAWLETWREKLKKTGTLDLDDLAQIASLTPEQFRTNLAEDEVLSRANLTGTYYGGRDALRLYAVLSESQQAAIFTPGGIDMRGLTPEQWALAEKLISSKNAGYLTSREATFMLSATRTKRDKQWEYAMTITTSDGLEPLKWSMTTPLYEERKPKPAAGEPAPKTNTQTAEGAK